jgi:heptosyltransferase-3
MPRMKILFITATRLGDAVLSTGLLDYMLRQWPEGKVTVACGTLPVSIFEGFPNVEKIIAVKKKPWNGHWVDLWKQVFGTKWDMVVDLRNTAVSRLVFAGQKYVYGPRIDKNLHKVEQAGEVMRLKNLPAPRLYFTKAQEVFADRLVGQKRGQILAVGPSANWIGKIWPVENFIEVIKWITSDDGPMPNARVAVFAAPGEEAQARPVLESVPEHRRIDGIAKGTPGEAAAAIARCDFYIGNDSGLMHCAAAAGVPTLGLFGPTKPHLYAPWGDHTAYITTPESYDELTGYEGYDAKTLDRTLMTGLAIQDVINVIRNFEVLYQRLAE